MINKGNKTNSKSWNRYRVWASEQVESELLNWPVIVYDQVRFRALGRDPRRRVITSDTQLVIDGFPSSANSFLQRCLEQLVTMDELRFSDHQHSPAMIVRATKLNVPTIVCVRDPLECCSSASVRWPVWTLEEYLIRYKKFHQLILPHLDKVLVSPFEEIVENPLRVFQSANRKFGISIPIEREIDLSEAEQPGLNRQETSDLKAKTRKKKLEKLAVLKRDPALVHLLEQANEVYEQVVSYKG